MSCPFHRSRECPYRKNRCPFKNAPNESIIIEDLYSRGLIDTIERINQKDRMIQKHGLPIQPNALAVKRKQANALYDAGLIDSLSRDLRTQFKTVPGGIKKFGESIGLVTNVICENGICKEISHVIVNENGNGPISRKLKSALTASPKRKQSRRRTPTRKRKKRKTSKRRKRRTRRK